MPNIEKRNYPINLWDYEWEAAYHFKEFMAGIELFDDFPHRFVKYLKNYTDHRGCHSEIIAHVVEAWIRWWLAHQSWEKKAYVKDMQELAVEMQKLQEIENDKERKL